MNWTEELIRSSNEVNLYKIPRATSKYNLNPMYLGSLMVFLLLISMRRNIYTYMCVCVCVCVHMCVLEGTCLTENIFYSRQHMPHSAKFY